MSRQKVFKMLIGFLLLLVGAGVLYFWGYDSSWKTLQRKLSQTETLQSELKSMALQKAGLKNTLASLEQKEGPSRSGQNNPIIVYKPTETQRANAEVQQQIQQLASETQNNLVSLEILPATVHSAEEVEKRVYELRLRGTYDSIQACLQRLNQVAHRHFYIGIQSVHLENMGGIDRQGAVGTDKPIQATIRLQLLFQPIKNL